MSDTRSSPDIKEALHYLSAIKVRLELLYEHSTQDARLLEHLSDEVDWVDAEIERLRSTVEAATPSTLLTRARQFVADSGSDEDDSEVNAARNQLLAEMDAALTGSVAQRSGWRPLDTAPKDGTRIILSWGGKSVSGWYLDNSKSAHLPWEGWRVASMEAWPKGQPDAWQPFPAPAIPSTDRRSKV